MIFNGSPLSVSNQRQVQSQSRSDYRSSQFGLNQFGLNQFGLNQFGLNQFGPSQKP